MFTTGLRLELQERLKVILGSPNVYYQPPANLQIAYPCIVYNLDRARTEFAGNMPYQYTKKYQVTVIHDNPDSVIPDKIGKSFPMCLFDRAFTANNKHHSVFTLYF